MDRWNVDLENDDDQRSWEDYDTDEEAEPEGDEPGQGNPGQWR